MTRLEGSLEEERLEQSGAGALRVVHLNVTEHFGGAGKAAFRLHRGLRARGVDSTMLVASKTGDEDDVVEFRPPMDVPSRIRRRIRRERIEWSKRPYRSSIPEGVEPFSDDRSQFGDTVWDQVPAGAVVHLHWVTGFVDRTTLPASPGRALVWTLHDMEPFTGGCHYALGCERYRDRCGRCPQLGSERAHDLSARAHERKAAAYGALNRETTRIVTPSRWLAEQCAESRLLGELPISVIPNGVDTDVFRPRDAAGLRSALAVEEGQKVLLFVAMELRNHRKGLDLLLGALEHLPEPRPVLVTIGAGRRLPVPDEFRHVNLGYVMDDRLLSFYYSAANAVVIPSREDNLPNTGIEALACGTPVVGFDAGGIPEIARPGETGAVARAEDPGALGDAITSLLALDDDGPIRGRCRELALREFDVTVQARRYHELYEGLVGEPSPSPTPGASSTR